MGCPFRFFYLKTRLIKSKNRFLGLGGFIFKEVAFYQVLPMAKIPLRVYNNQPYLPLTVKILKERKNE
jgi:hypothetical protein